LIDTDAKAPLADKLFKPGWVILPGLLRVGGSGLETQASSSDARRAKGDGP